MRTTRGSAGKAPEVKLSRSARPPVSFLCHNAAACMGGRVRLTPTRRRATAASKMAETKACLHPEPPSSSPEPLSFPLPHAGSVSSWDSSSHALLLGYVGLSRGGVSVTLGRHTPKCKVPDVGGASPLPLLPCRRTFVCLLAPHEPSGFQD